MGSAADVDCLLSVQSFVSLLYTRKKKELKIWTFIFIYFSYSWYKISTVHINTHRKEHTVCTMQNIGTQRKLSKVHAELILGTH